MQFVGFAPSAWAERAEREKRDRDLAGPGGARDRDARQAAGDVRARAWVRRGAGTLRAESLPFVACSARARAPASWASILRRGSRWQPPVRSVAVPADTAGLCVRVQGGGLRSQGKPWRQASPAMDNEDLYDEFGNYIGPDPDDDEDEEVWREWVRVCVRARARAFVCACERAGASAPRRGRRWCAACRTPTHARARTLLG